MSAADQQQLAAGGLVPTSTKLGKADMVDAVVARAYRHAVLPNRTVIRLVAEGVVAGDELEMATLGFGAGEDRGAVAKERKRALGFPGWALVNDPKNARYALDVVKELKKVARRVKNKPGSAKEGFDKIAATLGKTVPHFLPSFYEEVGRMFLEHGATSFAATYFGKAREAEAVHALEVDEQHRVDAFLEFALAGAVTTKALSAYAKDLGEHHKPADAYAHFRKLCVQRTLGGMPPWAGMAKDLQRLAKAAKLDVDAEDRSVVAEIIASPALGRAAGEFWRAYREPILELGKKDPVVRAVLLNLFPVGNTYSAEADNAWLDLVEETGAIESLVGPGDPAVQPAGGRAAWFDKLTPHLARDWKDRRVPERAFALLRRMAPQLVADGRPIRCVGRYQTLDLDLCELALELGVPVALVTDPKRPWATAKFGLEQWAQWADKPERGRDPVKTAAHPVMGPQLVKAVDDAIGKDGFDRVSAGKGGFLAAKRTWLEQQLASATSGALPNLVDALARINTKAKATLFAELPDLHEKLGAIDVAPALARSLQIGMIDELGWPALEAVMKELSPDGQTQVAVHGGPPALICSTKTKIVAVGATGTLGEHDLVVPPNHEFHTARWIGGRFLVVLKERATVKGYWSTSPTDMFTAPDVYVHSIGGIIPRAAVTPDGGWLEMAKAIYAGDRVVPNAQQLRAYDGTTAWIADPADNTKWREVSAAGEMGRASWPQVIEQAIEDGWKVDARVSWVLPATAPASPIGTRDNLVGAIALFKTDGAEPPTTTHRRIIAIGGPTWTAPTVGAYTGLLPLPGASEPRVLSEYSAYREGAQTTIWDPSLKMHGSIVQWKDRDYSRAQAVPLSPIFWHMYSIRDERGSLRLRAVTTEDARTLIAAIPVDANGAIPTAIPDEPFAAALPEVTSQQVRNGVTGFAIVAVKAQQERDRLVRERAPGMATAQAAGPSFSNAAINTALENCIDRVWNKDGATWAQIDAVARWFASEDRSNRAEYGAAHIPATDLDWAQLVPARSVLAFAALAIGTPAKHRAVLAALFGHFARSFPETDKLRVYGVDGGHGFPGHQAPTGVHLRWHAGNAYAIRRRNYAEQYRVLEYAPGGQFKPPPAGRIYDEVYIPGAALPEEAVRDIEAAIAAGKTTWSPDVAARIAEGTGLSPSAATYLWAGMPNIHDRSNTFMSKELREQLELKAAQATLGRDAIKTMRDVKRIAALEACARRGVAAMLDGSAADALVDAWVRLIGKRVAVPEALIAEADAALQVTGQAATWLSMFAAPDDSPQLSTDAVFALDRAGGVIRTSKPEPLIGQDKLVDPPPAFDSSIVLGAAQYLPFLFAELPVGDELREAAARSYELIQQRLQNPALWYEAGAHYMSAEGAATFARLLDGLGGEPLTTDANTRGVRIPGAAIFLMGQRATLKLQPAALDARATPLVDKLVAVMSPFGNPVHSALKYVRSPGLAQMIARIRDTPVPVGGWEQNPMLSAPTLVDKVAKKSSVSRDAAALYLQYLVLLWPTPKLLLEYNGWKPKQLAAAQAELVEKGLIIEAKRERAQRAHFLPGAWEALKAPNPPMESWKVPLYGVRDVAGAIHAPNVRFLALAPFHAMFEAAWARIEDNDTPRYDEVKR